MKFNAFMLMVPVYFMVSVLSPGVTVAQGQPQGRSSRLGWGEWLAQRFKPNPPLPKSPGVTRPVERLCLLAPNHEYQDQGNPIESRLWQDPVFFWTGSVAKVGVRQAGSEALLWTVPVQLDPQAEVQSLRYAGPRLEPGMTYEWGIFLSAADTQPQIFRTFQVMERAERGPVVRAWLREEIALRQTGASPQNRLERRLDFLLERELFADFYQELFFGAVRGQLQRGEQEIVQGILQQFCLPQTQIQGSK